MLLGVSRDTSLENAVLFHFIEGKEGKRISRPNLHRDYSSSLLGVRHQTPLSRKHEFRASRAVNHVGADSVLSPGGRQRVPEAEQTCE